MCLSPVFGKFKCGKCFECQLQYSYEWAFRICLEASLYKDNCMLTLTYNEANLPKGGILLKSDFQKFIKRLRIHLERKEDTKVRYFGVGEYGDQFGRPHYHIIIFGWKPKDLQFLKVDKKGNTLYTSPFLSSIWSKGFHSVGDVNLSTAKYCALYLQKNLVVDDKPKPFVLMSTRPAIGVGALKDKWLDTDKIYFGSSYMKIPRAYLKYFEKNGFADRVEDIKKQRNDNMFNYLMTFYSEEIKYIDSPLIDLDTGEVVDVPRKVTSYLFNEKAYKETFTDKTEAKKQKFIEIFGRWR